MGGKITVEDVDSLVSEPVTRVVIRAPEHDAREFAAVVEGLGLTETNYYIGYTAWLDLAPQGVSKASGLEMVCARLDVAPGRRARGRRRLQRRRDARVGRSRRGDGPGARSTCVAVADAVTGTVAEDGLVAELLRYL